MRAFALASGAAAARRVRRMSKDAGRAREVSARSGLTSEFRGKARNGRRVTERGRDTARRPRYRRPAGALARHQRGARLPRRRHAARPVHHRLVVLQLQGAGDPAFRRVRHRPFAVPDRSRAAAQAAMGHAPRRVHAGQRAGAADRRGAGGHRPARRLFLADRAIRRLRAGAVVDGPGASGHGGDGRSADAARAARLLRAAVPGPRRHPAHRLRAAVRNDGVWRRQRRRRWIIISVLEGLGLIAVSSSSATSCSIICCALSP